MTQDLVGQRVDRYQVVSQIGQGGFGAVYRAQHTVVGHDVALKVLWPDKANDPVNVERFLREARAAASIGSLRIARVVDAGTTEDGLVFLALELLEGRDLSEFLRRGQSLPLDESLRIVDQVLEGLSAAHAQGIVHRDLKPGNVFVTLDGDVKLLDFGISKILGAESLTQRGMALGTPRFMAPEQLTGQTVDARADLYAVGAMLYRMLAGVPAHRGSGYDVLVRRVKGEKPVPLGERVEVPSAIADVVHRAMAIDREDRWPSAGSLRRALDAARDGRPVPKVDLRATASPSVSPLSGPVARQLDDGVTETSAIDGTVKMPSVRPPAMSLAVGAISQARPAAPMLPATRLRPSSEFLGAAVGKSLPPPGVAISDARTPLWAWLGLAGLAALLALGLGVLGVLAWRITSRPARPRAVSPPAPLVVPVPSPMLQNPTPQVPTPMPAALPAQVPDPVPALARPSGTADPAQVPDPAPALARTSEAAGPAQVRFEHLRVAGSRAATMERLEACRDAFARCSVERPVSASILFTLSPDASTATGGSLVPDDRAATACVAEAFMDGPPVLFSGMHQGASGTVVVELPARE